MNDGLNVHYNDQNGNTLFYYVVYSNNNYDINSRIQMIDILLKHGLDIEASYYEELLFLLCRDHVRSNIAKKLI